VLARVAFVIALTAMTAVATPCLAIETGSPGGPPSLPPPPPPPLTAAPPGSGGVAPARPKPAASGSVSTSTSTTSSTSTSAPPAASDTGSGGPHALDTRWFIAPVVGFLSDNYGLGLGVRGGKTLDNHIYIGGTFIDHFGTDGFNSLYVGPEGGYDFDLRYVVVRPYLGLGLFSDTGGSQFVVWPGCSVLWDIPGSNFFLVGDLRLVSAPLTPVGVYFMAGMHFGS
jgi:hypothetical protein